MCDYWGEKQSAICISSYLWDNTTALCYAKHRPHIMNINQKNEYGSIDISMETIASVAGRAAAECYGVIGLTKKGSFSQALSELLRIEDYVQGVYARKSKKGYEVDLYLICANGVKLTEILSEVQKKVKYDLERTFEMKFAAVNVFVQDIREIS